MFKKKNRAVLAGLAAFTVVLGLGVSPLNPATGASAQGGGAAAVSQERCEKPWEGRKVIPEGHLDLSAEMDGNRFAMFLHDDSGIFGPALQTKHNMNDVVLKVAEKAKISQKQYGQLNQELWSKILDFNERKDYLLPLAQQQGLPWPGYNTQHISRDQVQGNFSLELVDFKGPGKASLATLTDFGSTLDVLL
ncbi:MAG: choice-of-anchor M domain-containing protein, partial [Microbacteriaceae bacterium]|nr:choice-of-anchor M domain-containing protein [Microbacteriaceae bacterium]